MASLRLALVSIGVAVIVGILVWEIFKRRRKTVRTPARTVRKAPVMDSLPRRADAAEPPTAEALDTTAPKPEPTEPRPAPAGEQRSLWEDQPERPAAQEGDSAPITPQELIILDILAPRGRPFAGQEIFEAATNAGMVHGEMQIFHCYPPHADAQQVPAATVFSMANLVEPGTFALEELDGLSSPGLVVFMQLPGPLAALDAFDMMLAVSRALAKQLGGTLCDEGRNPLSPHGIEDLKERILTFNLRLHTG